MKIELNDNATFALFFVVIVAALVAVAYLFGCSPSPPVESEVVDIKYPSPNPSDSVRVGMGAGPAGVAEPKRSAGDPIPVAGTLSGRPIASTLLRPEDCEPFPYWIDDGTGKVPKPEGGDADALVFRGQVNDGAGVDRWSGVAPLAERAAPQPTPPRAASDCSYTVFDYSLAVSILQCMPPASPGFASRWDEIVFMDNLIRDGLRIREGLEPLPEGWELLWSGMEIHQPEEGQGR